MSNQRTALVLNSQPAPFPEAQAFPSASKNAQNGRKVDPTGQFGEDELQPPDFSQAPPDKEVARELTPQEQAYFAAEYARLSDIERRRAGGNPAGDNDAPQPEIPCEQVAIPTAAEILGRKKMGRPRIIDDVLQSKIVALLGAGASLAQTAAHLGLARSTIAAAMERDPEFALEVHESRQRASLFPLNCLLREAAKNWRAAAWLLTHFERKCDQEKSRRERLYEAADRQIERDMVEEMRQEARQHRQAESQAMLSQTESLENSCQGRMPPRCDARHQTDSSRRQQAQPTQP